MAATLPEDQRLHQISPRAFEHPADRAATAALQKVPMLDLVVRKLIELGYETAFRAEVSSGAVRSGPEQRRAVWADHVAAYARLDLDPVPGLFVAQMPIANAAAVGSGKPMVIVHSHTIDLLDQQELRTVLAHEAGHVLADHVLYITALQILLRLGVRTPFGVIAGLPLFAVRLALLEWFRAAELSADRAATLVNRDPLVTCRTLMTISSGIRSERLNLDAFIEQGRRYREEEAITRLRRLGSELMLTHSRPVKRAHEVMTWLQSGEYDRIVGGEYVRRGAEAGLRGEAEAAQEHYAERVRAIFREAGEAMAGLGDQVADASGRASEVAAEAAEKLQEWLRGRAA